MFSITQVKKQVQVQALVHVQHNTGRGTGTGSGTCTCTNSGPLLHRYRNMCRYMHMYNFFISQVDTHVKVYALVKVLHRTGTITGTGTGTCTG